MTLEDKEAVTQKAAGGRERKVAWLHNVRCTDAFILPCKTHHRGQDRATDVNWLFETHIDIFFLLKQIFSWMGRGKEERHNVFLGSSLAWAIFSRTRQS